jgi:hypothetical protein
MPEVEIGLCHAVYISWLGPTSNGGGCARSCITVASKTDMSVEPSLVLLTRWWIRLQQQILHNG